MIRVALFVAVAGALTACGEPETAIYVEVDLTAYDVPRDVNLLHLELASGVDTFGRNVRLDIGQTRPAVKLVPGERVSRTPTLVIFAFLEDRYVSESTPTPLAFEEGQEQVITVTVP